MRSKKVHKATLEKLRAEERASPVTPMAPDTTSLTFIKSRITLAPTIYNKPAPIPPSPKGQRDTIIFTIQ